VSHVIKLDGARLIGTLVITYVEQEFGVSYSLTNIYRLLHQLDFLWIISRSRYPKQSQDAQDEARFSQQNTTTRLWGTKGSRPRAVKQQQFEYAGHPMPICLVRYARQREKQKP
jgi:hypothetical protein